MLALIPPLWWLGVLQLRHLIVVAVIVGIGSVFFDVSYQRYIPLIVESRQVPDANSTLEASFQVARIGGPALAGALLAVLAAPVLLLADAVSHIVAALSRIRDREIVSDPSECLGLGHEIAEGVRFVAGQPLIRRVVGTATFSNFFAVMSMTLLPLLLLKTLDLGTGTLGIIYSVGAVGGLLGALATPHLARKVGQGTIIPLSAIASGLPVALIPLLRLPRAAIQSSSSPSAAVVHGARLQHHPGIASAATPPAATARADERIDPLCRLGCHPDREPAHGRARIVDRRRADHVHRSGRSSCRLGVRRVLAAAAHA
jgi:MFS family permease